VNGDFVLHILDLLDNEKKRRKKLKQNKDQQWTRLCSTVNDRNIIPILADLHSYIQPNALLPNEWDQINTTIEQIKQDAFRKQQVQIEQERQKAIQQAIDVQTRKEQETAAYAQMLIDVAISATIINNPFKNIKEAKAAGYSEIRDYQYGGTQINIKGHRLVKDPKEAISKTAWKEAGFQLKADQANIPHTQRHRTYPSMWYGVYRDDQVEKIIKPKVERQAKNWDAVIAAKYERPADAIPDAAQALFLLNKYTRADSCSFISRNSILAAKSKFIQALYRMECYTDRVEKLIQTLDVQICFGCDGSGSDWGDECYRCDGTGIWREAKKQISYAFYFDIEGAQYCWMSPDFALGFKPKVEETKEFVRRESLQEEQPVIPKNIKQCIALIEFAAKARNEELEILDEIMKESEAI
jgi:hypothetical protein